MGRPGHFDPSNPGDRHTQRFPCTNVRHISEICRKFTTDHLGHKRCLLGRQGFSENHELARPLRAHRNMPTPRRRTRLLAIDDEATMRDWLKVLFETAGYETRTVSDGGAARAVLATWRPDVVITDLLLPDVDDTELVESISRLRAGIPVIVLTGQGNIPRSVNAVKAGAFDVLEKPIDGDLLLDKIDKALRQYTLIEENVRLRHQLHDGRPLEGVIGTSEKMRHLFELVECVSPARTPEPRRTPASPVECVNLVRASRRSPRSY